ncbi:MAG: hypothetical protein MI784_12085, partial [Cytophagales bacterium]|nr:hypothetical protein [Cytophagales bacterium]
MDKARNTETALTADTPIDVKAHYGNDILPIHSSIIEALEDGLLKPYGNFILSGLEIKDGKIQPGRAYINGKIAYFDSVYEIKKWSFYAVLTNTVGSSGSKRAEHVYEIAFTEEKPPQGTFYLFFDKAEDWLKPFPKKLQDPIQDAEHRFVTDREKNNWNGHLTKKNNPHGVTKEQVELGNIPNAISDDLNVSEDKLGETLATIQALKSVNDRIKLSNEIDSDNDTDIATSKAVYELNEAKQDVIPVEAGKTKGKLFRSDRTDLDDDSYALATSNAVYKLNEAKQDVIPVEARKTKGKLFRSDRTDLDDDSYALATSKAV